MKNVTRFLASMAAVALMVAASSSVQAGFGGCSDCGCSSGVKKVCRKVCKTKTVKVKCWSSKCEDFCLADPPDQVCDKGCDSGGCNGGCDSGCDGGCDSGCDSGCGHGHDLLGNHNGLLGSALFGSGPHRESCTATVYTRKKLGYVEVEKEVPVVTWELVELCDSCCAHGDCVAPCDLPPDAEMQPAEPEEDVPPAPPEPTAKRDAPSKVRLAKSVRRMKTQSTGQILDDALKAWNK